MRERVRHTIDKTTTVPAFSVVVQKLINLTTQPHVDLEEISKLARIEPGLATKFLQVANSAFYGGNPLNSVEDAILRIGTIEIRKLAMLITMMDGLSCFRRTKPITEIDPHLQIDWTIFWRHSLLTARLNEHLIAAIHPPSGREYLAGLLHDIGKLFLHRHFPSEFEIVMIRAKEDEEDYYSAENQLLDTHHAEVGAFLGNKWKLHSDIIEAIHSHHVFPPVETLNSPESPAVAALTLVVANLLAGAAGTDIHGKNPQPINPARLPGWNRLSELAGKEIQLPELNVEMKFVTDTIQFLNSQSPPPAIPSRKALAELAKG
ncbi:MAG: HDOD domain-containing protein [Verrucomicrobiae bacterium]|nr:HDOD domain-containing protein [Verrucomicrobiae bacterium]